MHPILKVLIEAKNLVSRGFVQNRDYQIAEDGKGKTVQFTARNAKKFAPSAAIWLEESRFILNKGKISYFDKALSLLHAAGYTMEGYRNAKNISEITQYFDIAIADFQESDFK